MEQKTAESPFSDREIIKRVLNGEKELYEIIIRRNNQLLYRVIRGYLDDVQDVEDVMQEAYISAYVKLHQFRGDAAFSTWLVRIGINEALKHLRKQQKIMDNHISKDITENIAEQDYKTPEGKVIHIETREEIDKAIDELPPMYRSVFILREVEGMSMDEVAQSLQITVSNVKVRLHRAKNLLKDVLREPVVLNNVYDNVYAYGSRHCDLMTYNVMKKIMDLPLPQ